MARLFADEDFPLGAVQILRGWGHDVLTAQEAGRSGAADPDIQAEATADGRAVVTHNHRDYKRLHRRAQPHGGIISCSRDDADLTGLALRIHDALTAASDLTNRFAIIRPNPRTKP